MYLIPKGVSRTILLAYVHDDYIRLSISVAPVLIADGRVVKAMRYETVGSVLPRIESWYRHTFLTNRKIPGSGLYVYTALYGTALYETALPHTRFTYRCYIPETPLSMRYRIIPTNNTTVHA